MASHAKATTHNWRHKPDSFNGEPRPAVVVAPSVSDRGGCPESGHRSADPPRVGEVRWTGPRFLHLRWTGAAWEVVRYDRATRRFEPAVVIEPLVR